MKRVCGFALINMSVGMLVVFFCSLPLPSSGCFCFLPVWQAVTFCFANKNHRKCPKAHSGIVSSRQGLGQARTLVRRLYKKKTQYPYDTESF